mmetsp:Transcript_34817/g.80481  ORF Transcript_34817/g.80481 Transcript_34817/m.80481 type:complete len:174 (-) Transcript_34817:857-1378(-)
MYDKAVPLGKVVCNSIQLFNLGEGKDVGNGTAVVPHITITWVPPNHWHSAGSCITIYGSTLVDRADVHEKRSIAEYVNIRTWIQEIPALGLSESGTAGLSLTAGFGGVLVDCCQLWIDRIVLGPQWVHEAPQALLRRTPEPSTQHPSYTRGHISCQFCPLSTTHRNYHGRRQD